MAVPDRLDRAVRPEQQDLCRGTAPRQQGHEVERGMIAPVQAFEDEDQRGLGRQGIQHFGKLAQHTLPRGPLQFLLQVLSIPPGEEPGHLR
jgi:hypothetical protein